MSERNLNSVGGWLLLYIIGALIGGVGILIVSVSSLYEEIQFMLRFNKADNRDVFGAMMDIVFTTPYGIFFLLPLWGISAAWAWTALKLWQKKPYAVQWMGVIIILNMFLTLVGYHFSEGAENKRVNKIRMESKEISREAVETVSSLFISLLWLFYFKESKRVLNVYGKNFSFSGEAGLKICLKCGTTFDYRASTCSACGAALSDGKLVKQAMEWMQGKSTEELEGIVAPAGSSSGHNAPEIVAAAREILAARSHNAPTPFATWVAKGTAVAQAATNKTEQMISQIADAAETARANKEQKEKEESLKICLKCGTTFDYRASTCSACGAALSDGKLVKQAMEWMQGKSTEELEGIVAPAGSSSGHNAPEIVAAAREILAARSHNAPTPFATWVGKGTAVVKAGTQKTGHLFTQIGHTIKKAEMKEGGNAKVCLNCGISFDSSSSTCPQCGGMGSDEKFIEQAMEWIKAKGTGELEKMVKQEGGKDSGQYAPEMVEAARRILSTRSNKGENEK